MARSHLYLPITDSDGNVVPNTKVTVYEAGTTALLAQTIYTQKLGSPSRTNPWTTSDGYIDIWLDRPQSVRIGLAVQGATETYHDDLSVLPPPEYMVTAYEGFQVINDGVDGWFLQSGQDGRAAWVDAGDLVNSKPSPLYQIYGYDFSGSSLDDLTVLNPFGGTVAVTYDDVSADPKPLGWESFTQALHLPSTTNVTVRAPGMTFPETGTVIFLYKVVSAAAGVGAAMLRVKIDDELLYVETPTVADLCNTWVVGYLDEIPSGTHRLAIEHRPGSDPTSYVQIGPIWVQYGNNIPHHEHRGTAEDTVRIGTASDAPFAGATVVGVAAKAQGGNATALGFDALVAQNGVGIGSGTRVGLDGVALGYRAATALGPGMSGGVAVGKLSATFDWYGVAIGPSALAHGMDSVALGSAAQTGNAEESVAIGSVSKALSRRGVAIGRGAEVAAAHDYSIAIGAGVKTTADHQAMIGDEQTTVMVPGNFRQTGGSALFGAASGKLGFFGSPGITRPVVTGSRANNAVLRDLLQYLDSMGIVKDSTSA